MKVIFWNILTYFIVLFNTTPKYEISIKTIDTVIFDTVSIYVDFINNSDNKLFIDNGLTTGYFLTVEDVLFLWQLDIMYNNTIKKIYPGDDGLVSRNDIKRYIIVKPKNKYRACITIDIKKLVSINSKDINATNTDYGDYYIQLIYIGSGYKNCWRNKRLIHDTLKSNTIKVIYKK